jgi:hypothetical protein
LTDSYDISRLGQGTILQDEDKDKTAKKVREESDEGGRKMEVDILDVDSRVFVFDLRLR